MSEIVAAFKLPIPVDQLAVISDTLQAIYGEDLYFHEEEFGRHDGRWLKFEKRETND